MVDKGLTGGKKIILIVIDSLIPKILETCLDSGTVPGMEFLSRKGQLCFDCVSVFPTMTPVATSSIATGVFPNRHQIPGFIWYHRGEKRIINYGATPLAILKTGFDIVLKDLLYHLNGQHLSRETRTVHEILEEHGVSSASINFYIFRGLSCFKVRLPFWARLLSGIWNCPDVKGPSTSVVGQIVPPEFPCKGALKKPGGFLQRFGVNDEFAGTTAYYLIKGGKQPDFTVVYLPDMDSFAHRHHIKDTSQAVITADRQVQKILNAFGSWQEAVENNIFIVVGDHSQSLVCKKHGSIINLSRLLSGFSLLGLGEINNGRYQLAVCPNERMAHIYLLKDIDGLKPGVLKILAADSRIDQIMWRETRDGTDVYNVIRGGCIGRLTFSKGGSLSDLYGAAWNIKGDLGIIDARTEDKRIIYGHYPDALNLMASLMSASHCGDIVVTARPGFEFGGEAAPVHPGRGSHGSFHQDDIYVPLITSGGKPIGPNPRIVDIVPYILDNYGISF
ncbi:MAG TPA: alkaline phosphatase family protein [Desulfobacteria bacterium]|nr:alkaline phosphatase family protein [Desulfobacteria bacterium]